MLNFRRISMRSRNPFRFSKPYLAFYLLFSKL